MRIVKLDDPIKIISAKQEIETKLIEENKLENEMELQEFVKFLNLQNTIYVKDDTVVPFRIYEDILFTVATDEVIKELNEKLSIINYDFTKLKNIDMLEVYNGELDKYPFFFIINSKYYVVK